MPGVNMYPLREIHQHRIDLDQVDRIVNGLDRGQAEIIQICDGQLPQG